MARSLANKPNVVAPGGDYPHGRIKDDDGSNNGTPVDEEVYGDMHQFFEKLMTEAGVTANELPDNNYSGFQLFEALHNYIRKGSWTPITLQNGWIVVGSVAPAYRIDIHGRVWFRGTISSASATNSVFASAGSVPNPISNVNITLPIWETANQVMSGVTISPTGQLEMGINYVTTPGVNYCLEGISYTTE